METAMSYLPRAIIYQGVYIENAMNYLPYFYVSITWPWHVMEILDSLVTKQSCTSLRAHFKQLFNDEIRDCTVHWSIAALKVFKGNLFTNFDCLSVFTNYKKRAINSGTVYLCFFFSKSRDPTYLQRFGECTLSSKKEEICRRQFTHKLYSSSYRFLGGKKLCTIEGKNVKHIFGVYWWHRIHMNKGWNSLSRDIPFIPIAKH